MGWTIHCLVPLVLFLAVDVSWNSVAAQSVSVTDLLSGDSIAANSSKGVIGLSYGDSTLSHYIVDPIV